MTLALDRPDLVAALVSDKPSAAATFAFGSARRGPVTHPQAPGLEVVGAGVRVPLATGGTAEYANLDHGASAPALRVVRDTVDALLDRYASVHRGAGWHSRVCTSLYEGSREPVRSFVGGRADDAVIFTRHTTDSFNLLAHCLPARTTVVVFETEHHAALLPWSAGGRRTGSGAGWFGCPPPNQPRRPSNSSTTRCAVGPAGPALLVVTGASNVTGEIWPITELAAVARARGARVALDAAQLAPHRPFSIDRAAASTTSPCPATSCTRPYGAGALVGRADWLARRLPVPGRRRRDRHGDRRRQPCEADCPTGTRPARPTCPARSRWPRPATSWPDRDRAEPGRGRSRR